MVLRGPETDLAVRRNSTVSRKENLQILECPHNFVSQSQLTRRVRQRKKRET